MGGSVCFAGHKKVVWEYNNLPMGPLSKHQLEKINAKGISLTDNGFEHLGMKLLLSYLWFYDNKSS